MRSMKVDMVELLFAMEGTGIPSANNLLDMETGEVRMYLEPDITDEEDAELEALLDAEPERFEEIPEIPSREKWEVMAAFAEELDEEDLAELFAVALQGRGAFSRFFDLLRRYPDLDLRWREKERAFLLEEATAWLASVGIKATHDPLPPLEPPGPPKAAPSRKQDRGPRIGLLHLLLLGIPAGGHEVSGGVVLREVSAPSPGRARAIFKTVAMDLYEHHGIAWRKAFIKGRDRIEVEGVELALEGALVKLRFPVSKEVAGSFG